MEELKITLWTVCVTIIIYGQCRGHGYLKDPPSRSSMWRYGFHTPINYNDNQLSCGGFDVSMSPLQFQPNLFDWETSGLFMLELVQWNKNDGKCGICGDPWDGSRENETGRKYATGKISRHYRRGQTITVEVKLTAQHGGYFEFRICPNNNPSRKVTQQCLNRFLLQQPDGTTKYYPIGGSNTYSVQLVLPRGLTCSHCVFQWIWNTASNWGCEGEKCGKGLGHQEQFRGCADVSITSSGSSQNTIYTGSMPNAGSQTDIQQTGSNFQNGNSSSYVHGGQGAGSNTFCKATDQYRAQFPFADQFCITQCKAGRCLSEYFCTAACKNLNRLCEATPLFKAIYLYASHNCIKYCKAGHCPAQYCTDACRNAP